LPVTDHAVATFDLATDRVLTAVERRYGDLVLDRRLGAQVPAEVLTAALIEGARRAPLPPWPDDPDTTRLLGRMRFVQRERPQADLPPVDDDALFEVAVTLAPGRRSLAELRAGPWRDALLDRLTWAQRTELDRLAPESLEVPSGSHIRLDYPADGPPVLAVRIQELFGARATPTVAGRPVLLHLLAPNHRPQQVTDDLAGFWQRTWPEVRKDLRARYPRHSWPTTRRRRRRSVGGAAADQVARKNTSNDEDADDLANYPGKTRRARRERRTRRERRRDERHQANDSKAQLNSTFAPSDTPSESSVISEPSAFQIATIES
jgi:hypothetical protein